VLGRGRGRGASKAKEKRTHQKLACNCNNQMRLITVLKIIMWHNCQTKTCSLSFQVWGSNQVYVVLIELRYGRVNVSGFFLLFSLQCFYN
jgi:hypothetical protein